MDEDEHPIRLNAQTSGRSGRVKLDVVDWDGDGRLDILVNSENATWYRNCETRCGKIVLKKIGPLAKRNVAGHTSSPSTCDFNRDGKPDVLGGAENGRICISPATCVPILPKLSNPEAEPAGAPFRAGWHPLSFIRRHPFRSVMLPPLWLLIDAAAWLAVRGRSILMSVFGVVIMMGSSGPGLPSGPRACSTPTSGIPPGILSFFSHRETNP